MIVILFRLNGRYQVNIRLVDQPSGKQRWQVRTTVCSLTLTCTCQTVNWPIKQNPAVCLSAIGLGLSEVVLTLSFWLALA